MCCRKIRGLHKLTLLEVVDWPHHKYSHATCRLSLVVMGVSQEPIYSNKNGRNFWKNLLQTVMMITMSMMHLQWGCFHCSQACIHQQHMQCHRQLKTNAWAVISQWDLGTFSPWKVLNLSSWKGWRSIALGSRRFLTLGAELGQNHGRWGWRQGGQRSIQNYENFMFFLCECLEWAHL